MDNHGTIGTGVFIAHSLGRNPNDLKYLTSLVLGVYCRFLFSIHLSIFLSVALSRLSVCVSISFLRYSFSVFGPSYLSLSILPFSISIFLFAPPPPYPLSITIRIEEKRLISSKGAFSFYIRNYFGVR